MQNAELRKKIAQNFTQKFAVIFFNFQFDRRFTRLPRNGEGSFY